MRQFSNQFPVAVRTRPTTGTLYYNGQPVFGAIGLRFCELGRIKGDMICHGWKKELFKIKY